MSAKTGFACPRKTNGVESAGIVDAVFYWRATRRGRRSDIASVLKVGVSTVTRVRRRCVEEGLEAALGRKKQARRRQRLLDGEAEAHLVALACGKPPQGRAKWTIKLLAQRLVECEIVETVGLETVRRALKKTLSSPG